MPKGKAQHLHLEPKLAYLQCLNLFLVTPTGCVETVASCSSGDFAALVQKRISAAPKEKRESLTQALARLDYGQKADRWYAANTLIEHGAPLPLHQYKAAAATEARKQEGRIHDYVNSSTTPSAEKTKAQASLAENQARQNECRSRLAHLDSEHAALLARAEQRSVELATLQQTADTLRKQYEQLHLHATFAVGTLAPESDGKAKAAEREWRKAERALESVQPRISAEAERDAARLQQITVEQETIRGQLADLEHQIQLIAQVIADADAAIGEEEYRDAAFQLSMLNEQLSARRSALAAAKRDLEDFTGEALERLNAWPERQAQLSQQLPYTDEATQFLDAAITFYRVLLNSGQQVNIDSDLLRQLQPWRNSLAEWLAPLDVSDLWAVFNGRFGEKEIRNLQERQANLEKLLAVYREQHQAARAGR